MYFWFLHVLLYKEKKIKPLFILTPVHSQSLFMKTVLNLFRLNIFVGLPNTKTNGWFLTHFILFNRFTPQQY